MTSSPQPATAPEAASRQPRGLYVLFFTELWERFSFYGMQALLVLYMTKHLHFSEAESSRINGWYSGLVYLTPFFGGLLADRFLGYKKSIILGGTLMMIGHFLMAIDRLPVFFAALAFLVLGVGGLKANISTVVGKLYRPGDPRRDRGFTIFYMGINLGAFFSPLVCGYLGERVSWHLGFAAAGVGMAFGLATFVLGQGTLRDVDMSAPPRAEKRVADTSADGFSREEVARIVVLAIVSCFVVLFWAGYIQTWITLTFWADAHTNRVLPAFLGGAQIPASWFQSVNPLFVITLAPVFSAIWGFLARRGKEPSTPAKMALGLAGLGVAFGCMVLAALTSRDALASPWWLVGCYFFMSLGELVLSPVGLSLVTKLAPARIGAMLMGIWFLGNALGYKLGGYIGELWGVLSPAGFFGLFVASSLVAAAMFLALLPTMKRMMHGAA